MTKTVAMQKCSKRVGKGESRQPVCMCEYHFRAAGAKLDFFLCVVSAVCSA